MKTAILGVVLAPLIAVPAMGREIVVDLSDQGDFTEIQFAIDEAEDGDTVLVKPGEYVITESIRFNRLIDPDDVKDIVLRFEAGSAQTTIRIDPRLGEYLVVFRSRETEASVVIDPGDYHLQPASPCVDSGTPDGAPRADYEGSGRPCGEGVDMGAYESSGCPPPIPFKRRDSNADGNRNVADAVFVLSHLFSGGAAPPCMKAADANDTGSVDLTDAVYVLDFLFGGGARPAAPFADCGMDATADELSCDSFPAC